MTRHDQSDPTVPTTATEQRLGAVTEDRTIDLTRSAQSDDLMAEPDRLSLQQRWSEAQGRFVDDPRAAVREADALVAEVVRAVTHRFSEQRDALEQQWSRDEEPGTEQLRQALQRYRSLFSRLLAA